MKQVVVAVVSFNTRDLLRRCLDSLAPEAEHGRAEVWVVDNDSEDGSAGLARDHAPWARVIETGSNLGFGRAVNLVAGRTTSTWLACVNADVALEPGALERMLDAGADPAVGCVAPRLVLDDGRTQESLHSLPTLPFTLALNLGLHRLSPRLADRMLIPGRYDLGRPRQIPWAIGACLLFRRAAFESVGRFDERQWMYAEDLDIGWRLQDAGWVTRYEPQARVRHASAAATRPAFGEDVRGRFMRETYQVLSRRRRPSWARLIALINVCGCAVRLAVLEPACRVSRRWCAPRDEIRGWLEAHRSGLRVKSSPLRQG